MLWTILVLVGILWRLSFVSDYAAGRVKKVAFCRHFLTGLLALVCWLPYSAMAVQVHEATVSAVPGTLVRMIRNMGRTSRPRSPDLARSPAVVSKLKTFKRGGVLITSISVASLSKQECDIPYPIGMVPAPRVFICSQKGGPETQ